ncbi:MAG: hypothetical protein R3C42_02140 [Parvularculaceae bacterium]|nr:hypothetical protein [Parvularculaceae bacterium]
MDGLVFIAALGVVILIVGWYLANEAAGADGAVGLLALKGEPAAKGGDPSAPKYRKKSRAAPARRGDRSRENSDRAYRPIPAECASRRFEGSIDDYDER